MAQAGIPVRSIYGYWAQTHQTEHVQVWQQKLRGVELKCNREMSFFEMFSTKPNEVAHLSLAKIQNSRCRFRIR